MAGGILCSMVRVFYKSLLAFGKMVDYLEFTGRLLQVYW